MKRIVCCLAAVVAVAAAEFQDDDALLQHKSRDLQQLPEHVRRHFNSTWLFETSEAVGLGWTQDDCDRRAEQMHQHVAANFLEYSLSTTITKAKMKADLKLVQAGCEGMFKVGTPASRCALASGASVSAMSGLFFGGGQMDLKSTVTALTDVGLAVASTFFPIAGIVGGLFQAFAMDILFPAPKTDPMQKLAEEILKQAGIMMDKKINFMLLKQTLSDVDRVIREISDDIHTLDNHRDALGSCGFPTAGHTCSHYLINAYQDDLNHLFRALRTIGNKIFDHSEHSTALDAQWYYRVLPMATIIAQLHATTILEMANLPEPSFRQTYQHHWTHYFEQSGSFNGRNWKAWSAKAIASVRPQITNVCNGCSPHFNRQNVQERANRGGKGGNWVQKNIGYKCVGNSGGCFTSLLHGSVNIAEETGCRAYHNHVGCSCNDFHGCRSCPSSDFQNACSTCDCDNVKAQLMNSLIDSEAIFAAITSDSNVPVATAKSRLRVTPSLIAQKHCHRPASPRRRCAPPPPPPVRHPPRPKPHGGGGGGKR